MLSGVEYMGAGADDGPVSPDNWKRAVYRPPPRHFSVEVLPPEKQGNCHSYGLLVTPILEDGASSTRVEYEIWRRWEDCLWFQDLLELTYRRLAISKKQRLLAGKGIKKNGIYIHDQAASFESLPPGPDPRTVAMDVHAYIPKLKKKGTIFRASSATVEQRALEFKTFIEALFSPDAPALISEIRQDRIVMDFFGFWRRDLDLSLKQNKDTEPQKPRTSITDSVFSSYFSSSFTTEDIPSSPSASSTFGSQSSRRRPSRPHTSAGTPSVRTAGTHDLGGEFKPRRAQYLSTSSSSSSGSSSVNSKASRGSDNISPVIIHGDGPIVFGHNPEDTFGRSSSFPLEPLPEGAEVAGSHPSAIPSVPLTARRRQKSPENIIISNRNGHVFLTPPISPTPSTQDEHDVATSLDAMSLRTSNQSARESWQTTTSVSDYLEHLNLPLDAISELSRRPAASTASIATFRTDCSADAIIPQSPSNSTSVRSSEGSRPRKSSFSDSDSSSQHEDTFDTYFYDASAQTKPGLPRKTSSAHPPNSFRSRSESMSSMAPSTFSDMSVSPAGMLTIKAAHNNAIVIVRTPCTISFEELKKRLYDKFVGQEGIPLSESFTIAHVLPVSAPKGPGTTRSRFETTSPTRTSDATRMYMITSQEDWEHAISEMSITGKLTLRVIDSHSK